MTKSVIVTGAGSGIGRALSRFFAGHGWIVCALDVDGIAVRHTLDEIVDVSPRSTCSQADIRDQDTMSTIYSTWVDTFGGVDALVNNAGITDKRHHRLLDLPLGVFNEVLSVNLSGTFVSLSAYASLMAGKNRGNIVNVTSLLGQPGRRRLGDTAYGVSKAAVEALSKYAAEDLAKFSINVNTVYPASMVDTEFFDYLDGRERGKLERPSILDEIVYVLSNLEAGELTGASVCTKRWREEQVLVKLADKYLNRRKL